MSGKGFGQRQPSKIDKIIESAVRYCQKRNPEALDKIFDNLPVKLNKQVLYQFTKNLIQIKHQE
ncbi:hypothetical protein [Calothrix sp. NIES-2098]|uniref:hypothetical protein n=1 Tax=Calothrix sp. NIES-2098 TaxID=1954171 RepID=UPI000B5FD96E|nr:hypothetical protein NIES2098_74050 [Calothrix sp. NIES-2098]